MIGGVVSGEFAMLGATYDMDIITMVSKCYLAQIRLAISLCTWVVVFNYGLI